MNGDPILWYSRPTTVWNEALPTAWPAGSVSGLRARGGFTVSMWWREGSLERATVAADTARAERFLMFAASAGTRYEITRAAGQPARPRGKNP